LNEVVRLHPLPRNVETRGERSICSDLPQSGFVQSAERQALTLEMGVRLSQPEPRPTAAQVNRRFPEQALTAERQRHGADGAMTNESDDNEAYPRLAMPLWRRWSARLAEAQEVLVRFQGVARRAGRRMRRRCGIASVARMQSSRFLPGSVLVQVQPEARVRARPTGEAAAFQAVPGGFDSHRPLDARAVQRLNAGPTRRRSLVRSQPRAPRRVLPGGQGTRSLTPGNTGSTPVHDTSSYDSVF
jgi:hypothetical protein